MAYTRFGSLEAPFLSPNENGDWLPPQLARGVFRTIVQDKSTKYFDFWPMSWISLTKFLYHIDRLSVSFSLPT
jgi:hypothetical protein